MQYPIKIEVITTVLACRRGNQWAGSQQELVNETHALDIYMGKLRTTTSTIIKQ